MSRKISFGLSEKEITRAIKEVERYKEELNKKIASLIAMLVGYGVESAKYQIRELRAVYTGELESSIEGYFNPASRTGIIRAGAWYAVYVEFGTGVVGQGSPHPAPAGWRYDVNNHGELGWWYFNDRDDKWHWTKGFKSRPFMYNTALELERVCERLAREVFKR